MCIGCDWVGVHDSDITRADITVGVMRREVTLHVLCICRTVFLPLTIFCPQPAATDDVALQQPPRPRFSALHTLRAVCGVPVWYAISSSEGVEKLPPRSHAPSWDARIQPLPGATYQSLDIHPDHPLSSCRSPRFRILQSSNSQQCVPSLHSWAVARSHAASSIGSVAVPT